MGVLQLNRPEFDSWIHHLVNSVAFVQVLIDAIVPFSEWE